MNALGAFVEKANFKTCILQWRSDAIITTDKNPQPETGIGGFQCLE